VTVHDLDILSAALTPLETDAELVIDPDAMLTSTITFERLEAISGWHPQIVEPICDFQLPQLAPCHASYIRETLNPFASG
jgi:hypothetical protein